MKYRSQKTYRDLPPVHDESAWQYCLYDSKRKSSCRIEPLKRQLIRAAAHLNSAAPCLPLKGNYEQTHLDT
jgi:hypothetical protein